VYGVYEIKVRRKECAARELNIASGVNAKISRSRGSSSVLSRESANRDCAQACTATKKVGAFKYNSSARAIETEESVRPKSRIVPVLSIRSSRARSKHGISIAASRREGRARTTPDDAKQSASKTVKVGKVALLSRLIPKFSPRLRRAANYRRGKTEGRTSKVSANKTVVARGIRPASIDGISRSSRAARGTDESSCFLPSPRRNNFDDFGVALKAAFVSSDLCRFLIFHPLTSRFPFLPCSDFPPFSRYLDTDSNDNVNRGWTWMDLEEISSRKGESLPAVARGDFSPVRMKNETSRDMSSYPKTALSILGFSDPGTL